MTRTLEQRIEPPSETDRRFKRLYDQYYSLGYGFVLRRLPHELPDRENVAEDLCSEIWLGVYGRLHAVDDKGAEVYIFTAHRNRVWKFYRDHEVKKRKYRRLEDSRQSDPRREDLAYTVENLPHDNVPQSIVDQEDIDVIKRLMVHLSDEHRELVMMFHFQELTYEEIKAETGLCKGTIKSRLTRARQYLKRMVDEPGYRPRILKYRTNAERAA